MTPTEQDKELRDKVATIVEYWDFSPMQDEDSRIERLNNEIIQLITQYGDTRERLGRIDEIKVVRNMWTKPGVGDIKFGHWLHHRESSLANLAELKEEV